MFIKRKETKKLELLQKKNIIINCKSKSKDEVIREVGQLLCDSGYVESSYIDAMLEREKIFATNIGNSIAIPHGVETAKKNIKVSGIAVMVFPEGTPWNDELVKVVIGIAGVGDDHLEVLANIANTLSTQEAVDKLVKSSADMILKTFTGEES